MEKDQVTNELKIVIIGGSAGSLEVLMKVLPQLTDAPKYALLIILHRKNTEDNLLEDLFAARTSIPVKPVDDKTPLEAGNIYIAPADYHLLIEKNGLLSLDTSEKINYSRPSIDVSFESAADAFRDSVTGILLSGANGDGTAGLIEIQNARGITIIQDPVSAEMPYMPSNAIDNLKPDFIMDPPELLEFLRNHNH